MKCLSCGKNFDGEKYYCICPKCGTYNKPEDKTSQTSPEADFIYEEPQAEADREDAVKALMLISQRLLPLCGRTRNKGKKGKAESSDIDRDFPCLILFVYHSKKHCCGISGNG